MSLRGRATEAISLVAENLKIAALPAVARNDEKGLRHSLASGNPRVFEQGSRLRGSDNHFVIN